jgi:AraC-like DNA-binding protein
MSEITVQAGKLKRLLHYLDQIGLDTAAIAGTLNLTPGRIFRLPDDQSLPAQQYARLYKAAVAEMQKLRQPIPWGAGIGSQAFELMCRCIISCRTLGEADTVRLSYHVNLSDDHVVLVPSSWDRAESRDTLARASGLVVWCALCGWLTGQPLEPVEVHIAAPSLQQSYYDRLERVFHCLIQFDAAENTLVFPRTRLERRLVQTPESLAEFLESSVYHLMAVDQTPASTSSAIKSLVSIDLPTGLPSFSNVARSLHMSESSLRRRLQREDTSYQALKDEIRCEVAIDHLLNQNAKVADIAEHLGFTEPSSFVRSFKSWTGQTPTAYRDRIQELGQA